MVCQPPQSCVWWKSRLASPTCSGPLGTVLQITWPTWLRYSTREVLPEARPSTRYSQPPCHPDEVQPPPPCYCPSWTAFGLHGIPWLVQALFGGSYVGPRSSPAFWSQFVAGQGQELVTKFRGHTSCFSADSTEAPKPESSPEPPPGQGRTRAGTQVPVLGPEDDLAGIFLQVQGLPWGGGWGGLSSTACTFCPACVSWLVCLATVTFLSCAHSSCSRYEVWFWESLPVPVLGC